MYMEETLVKTNSLPGKLPEAERHTAVLAFNICKKMLDIIQVWPSQSCFMVV